VRRTTAWALGGMLAGTVLLGTGGTLATFSDTESLSATAGAGRLALDAPSPSAQRGPQKLRLGSATLLPVQPEVVGAGTAQLRLSAVDARGGKPCDESIRLTVTLPGSTERVETGLCALTRTSVDLFPVSSTTPDFSLQVSVSIVGDGGSAAHEWKGDLRLTLVQAGGQGFSDEQVMPVHVVIPNPQGNNPTG
jgi:predicted ribosomally synthesized peptide with SipW-like signal peptide